MELIYKQAVLNILGGRIVILGIGSAFDLANEMAKHFTPKQGFKNPGECFLEMYEQDVDRWTNGTDKNLMTCGPVTYNLGGMVVIHSPTKINSPLLVHEIFHAVNAVAKSCGISDDEFNAHLGQYLFEQFAEDDEQKEDVVYNDGLIQPELF